MVHVTQLNTAHKIWKSLKAIHKTKDYQIAITIQCTLFRQSTSDGDNIAEHLTQLKKKWEWLNVLDDTDFCIIDIQFKTIIASSLPSSWDTFTKPYIECCIGATENNPKKLASSQEFIRILKEEYMKHKNRQGTTQQTYYSKPHGNNKQQQFLVDCWSACCVSDCETNNTNPNVTLSKLASLDRQAMQHLFKFRLLVRRVSLGVYYSSNRIRVEWMKLNWYVV